MTHERSAYRVGQVAAAVLLALGALAGMRAATVRASVAVDIDIAPPAPRVMIAPPPRVGFVWAPGYWNWNGHSHVWHDGYWVQERHGYHWVADGWVAQGPRYRYVTGHWAR